MFIYQPVFLYVHLSACVPVCPSVSLCSCMFIYQPVFLYVHLSACVPVCPSVSLCILVHPSVLSVCLPFHWFSIHLTMFLDVSCFQPAVSISPFSFFLFGTLPQLCLSLNYYIFVFSCLSHQFPFLSSQCFSAWN